MGFSSTKIRAAQLTITLLLLVSCKSADSVINTSIENAVYTNLGYQYKNNEWDIELSVPENFSSTLDNEGMYFGYGPAYGDFYLQVYQPNSSPSCSPSAIGINSPITLKDSKDENTIWGEMDYYKIFWTMDFPMEFTDICGYQKEQTAYAFCSEKDDKRVVICISQQTDDPKMAEEIFKTFRWTE